MISQQMIDEIAKDLAMDGGVVQVPKWEQQPPPKANHYPEVWNLVLADMSLRNQVGKFKYGVPLQPFNGRNALQDAYEEALDLCVYLRTALFEKTGK